LAGQKGSLFSAKKVVQSYGKGVKTPQAGRMGGVSNLRNSICIQPLSWLLHLALYTPDFIRGY
jgi:hypothetical protein